MVYKQKRVGKHEQKSQLKRVVDVGMDVFN